MISFKLQTQHSIEQEEDICEVHGATFWRSLDRYGSGNLLTYPSTNPKLTLTHRLK